MCFQALVSPFNIYNCYCYNKTFLLLFANAAPQKNVHKKTIGHGLEKMIIEERSWLSRWLKGRKDLRSHFKPRSWHQNVVLPLETTCLSTHLGKNMIMSRAGRSIKSA